MKIGDKILDKVTKIEEVILNITDTSVEITRTKLTDKGINCTNWFGFDSRNFKDRFL